MCYSALYHKRESISMYFNILYCIILYCIMSGEGVSLYCIIIVEGGSMYCIMSRGVVSMYCIMIGEGISLYYIMIGEGASLYCIMIGEDVSLYFIMSEESVCLPLTILPCNMMCGRVRLTINLFVKVQSIKVSTWLITRNETKGMIITKFFFPGRPIYFKKCWPWTIKTWY